MLADATRQESIDQLCEAARARFLAVAYQSILTLAVTYLANVAHSWGGF